VTRLWVGQLGFDSWKGQGFSPLCHSMQTGTGAHPGAYPVGIRGSFPKGKVASA